MIHIMQVQTNEEKYATAKNLRQYATARNEAAYAPANK